jgi:hypothetical protein
MYLRHTTRVKDGTAHTYWRLVRSVRVSTGGIKATYRTPAPQRQIRSR